MTSAPDPVSADLRLVVKKQYAASPATIFTAWTQPEQLKKWFSPKASIRTPIVEIDLRVGGRYRIGFQGEGDVKMSIVGGEYKVVDSPRKLVYTWRWERPHEFPDVDTLVTVEFLDCDGGTELILTHEGLASEPMKASHGEGWAGVLERVNEAI